MTLKNLVISILVIKFLVLIFLFYLGWSGSIHKRSCNSCEALTVPNKVCVHEDSHIEFHVYVLALLNLFSAGARMFHNPHEIVLRRKLEEQAELQQAIELEGRRLMNLQLPDFKNIPICRGASLPLPQLHSHISNPGLTSDSIKVDITG